MSLQIKPIVVALVLVAAAGCSRNAEPNTEQNTESPAVAADNTKRNERDVNDDTAKPALTAGDQSENAADRTITQQVRQQVVKSDDLSVNGKNVKIITVDGVVTLRGPVQTAQERSAIAKVAKAVDGVKRVDNQLEVAAN